MPKIGFNVQALGFLTSGHNRNMSRSRCICAFEPIVLVDSSVESVLEGIRLAHVKGLEYCGAAKLTKNVDT
jgi:hypothetical protein